jgi:hypothetical protein
MRRALFLPLLLATLGAAPLQQSQDGQDIVVTAQTRKALTDFVAALADTGPTGQIARWKTLCPIVAGIEPAEAEFMVGRIGAVAESVRLHADAPGCRPTTLILFTNDAAALAREFARVYPVTLRTDGRAKLKRFVASGQPIRWLSVTDPCGDGCSLPNSHIVRPTNPSFRAMIIIVDARQIAGYSVGELSDYLALVALGNPPLVAPRPRDSILSMFVEPRAAGTRFTLTPADRSFLAGLYRAPTNMDAEAQRSAIATHMQRERKKRH